MGRDACATLEELKKAVEQIAPLLFGRELDRLRDIREHSAQLRHELRHFRGRVPERLTKRRARIDPSGALDDLDPGDERRSSFRLVAPPGECKTPALTCLGQRLLGQPSLANTRLATQEHEGALSGDGPFHESSKLRPFRLPSDIWRAPTQQGRFGIHLGHPDRTR